jgi:spermatogenesis-associated protein 2
MFESARWVTDFSALKAARAFEAIEKYASNLINQPWRKEFKEIKVSLVYYISQLKSIECRESRVENLNI